MSLSDCPKCWDTPCTCGYMYKGYSIEQLTEFRDLFNDLIAKASIKDKTPIPCEDSLASWLQEKHPLMWKRFKSSRCKLLSAWMKVMPSGESLLEDWFEDETASLKTDIEVDLFNH